MKTNNKIIGLTKDNKKKKYYLKFGIPVKICSSFKIWQLGSTQGCLFLPVEFRPICELFYDTS
jgi:hypothetical protein